MDYIVTLQELNGLVIKFKDEYYQLMITDDFDVSFEVFFTGEATSTEIAKQLLDFVVETKKENALEEYDKALSLK